MTSVSQKNLLKLAAENQHNGNLHAAIENLEESLRGEHSLDVVLQLCELYCANKQEDQAYALIKEEPDLFFLTSEFIACIAKRYRKINI